MLKKLAIVAVMTAATLPTIAYAQGVERGARGGAREGAAVGEDVGGPVGGAVGGVVGGVTGGVAGGVGAILGDDDRPRFREYVVREGRPSYRWGGRVVVGSDLPEDAPYYAVPQEYHVKPAYRYAVIDGHTVLVQGRRIVQILD